MKLFFALLVAIIGVILLYTLLPHATLLQSPRQTVTVARVIDGDTLVTTDATKIRLINVNTPEHGEAGFEQASAFLSATENKSVELEITGTDRYDRTLARVYTPEYFNLKMVEQGLARPFLVNDDEAEIFDKAQMSAIENQRGLWIHSPYYGCVKVKLDAKNERATLRSVCDIITINNWYVRDESRKTYKFANLSLGVITLHSGKGQNTGSDQFWNSATSVWNDNRDTFYLYDEADHIVTFYSYGYG